ncbi:MAG: hypothetical protein ACI857_001479 [Arenicella sp.]|jgi:hypothetical protein
MKKLIFGIIAVSTLMVACTKEDSSDVNQQMIYSDYEVFYNKNEDKTHVVAKFRFGGPTGTVLELSDSTNASVSFEGDVLPFDPWYNAHHKEYAGNITTGSFSYTNTDGVTYVNAIPSGESIDFPIGFDTINKTAAETVAWAGTALVADQQVSLFVGTWTWGEDALFYTNALGATDVVMGINEMSNLAVGSSTVYMDRSTAKDISSGTPEGGRIRYKYRGTNVTAAVVE